MRHDIGRLLDHLAVAPNAITRQVGTDIEVDPERGNVGISDIGHADDGTRLWVELAKPVKRCRELLRQDRKIALHEAVGDAGGGRRHAGTTCQPRLQAREYLPLAVAAQLFRRQTGNHRTRSVPWQAVCLDRQCHTVLPCKTTRRINSFPGH
jgi:hypothetical protein